MAAPDRKNDLLAVPNPVDGDVRHARRRRRSKGFVAGLVAGALLLVGGGGAAAYFGYRMSLDDNMERIDPFAEIDPSTRPSAEPVEGPTAPVNILVLGSDSRISAGDPNAWEAGAQRTDAIMLVHLSADRESAAAISIPRDSWVPIPGHGEAKINAAFSYGGPPLMIQTVEDLTGVRIDHFAVTDFESFKALTDSLDGVEITVPDGDGGSERLAMTGEEALAFTRERYALSNGDFGRVQRQQAWMRAIVAKAKNSMSEPLKMASFLEAITSSVAVDQDLTLDRIQELFTGAEKISTNDISFMTAPYSGTGRSADGQSIVVLDRATFDPLMKAVAKDEVPDFLAANSDAMDVLPAVVQ
ncbi:transcriptional attenuator, LytR family [Promicromonospora umidemergens]|uniref:LCP family protein n=1 Tax=Promicromonospora umidemergens TaxID=629679 RepID=A0ABP8WQQ8_9MICO|nr:LCP family protein [Promicromonospora umidemergens]MCP2283158.1 transcriptional attenuator, LytR family [Promicromonospora umidemergens]